MLFGVLDGILDVTRRSGRAGGKDLYMGSCQTDTGKFRGHTGIVPGPPKGFRGSTGWGHPSRGATWAAWGVGQPLVGWVHPLPWALAPRVEGGTLEGAPPWLGGQATLSPWPPPPSRWDLEGPAPFSLPPINRGVRGGQPHHKPRRSPPLPNTSPPPLCAPAKPRRPLFPSPSPLT